MRLLLPSLFVLAAIFSGTPAAHAQSILENGNFDGADPLKGWVTDYEFTGNSWYVKNKTFISVAQEGSRKNIVKFGNNGDAGVKMESRAFPLEPGFKYTATFDIKGKYRVYFDGYQWLPGVRPHENPELKELREAYKGKAVTGVSPDAWKSEKIELPGVTLSDDAKKALRRVKYVTIYFYILETGAVDNVVITKTPDPSMQFLTVTP